MGEAGAAARARELAVGEGLMYEQLPYDRAVHTPLFAPFAEDLRATFARLPVAPPKVPMWSCTTAAPYPQDPEEMRELLVEHWTRPVRFRETIEALYDDGVRVFVEAGPRGNMTSFIEDILRGVRCLRRRRRHSPALGHRRSSTTSSRVLAVHDVELDLGYLFSQRRPRDLDWRPGLALDGGAGAEPGSPAGPGSGATARLEVPLSTSWPMLRLSEEALERVRPTTPADPVRNGHAPSPPEVVHAAASAAPPQAGRTQPEPDPVHAAALPAAPLSDAPAWEPGAAGDDVALAVEEHLRTMQQFLRHAAEVMDAYLTGGTAIAGEASAWPLLGTVVAHVPEAELVAQRVVDPASDPYLLDHTLGRSVSRSDPGLHALALMPLAMSIEILAEAACCLLPGRVVTGMREVRAHRWLAFGPSRRRCR